MSSRIQNCNPKTSCTISLSTLATKSVISLLHLKTAATQTLSEKCIISSKYFLEHQNRKDYFSLLQYTRPEFHSLQSLQSSFEQLKNELYLCLVYQ